MSKLDNVYSIKSRKKLGVQNTEANDNKAMAGGKYIGCLPITEANVIRGWQDSLIVQQAKINELIEEFDGDYKAYLRNIASVFLYYKYPIEAFNPEKDRLFVGEDGHTWIVPKESEDNGKG